MGVTTRTYKSSSTRTTYRCDNCSHRMDRKDADEDSICPVCERLYCIHCRVQYDWHFLSGSDLYVCSDCYRKGQNHLKTIRKHKRRIWAAVQRWKASCKATLPLYRRGDKTADGVEVHAGMKVHVAAKYHRVRVGYIDKHHMVMVQGCWFYPLSQAYSTQEAARQKGAGE